MSMPTSETKRYSAPQEKEIQKNPLRLTEEGRRLKHEVDWAYVNDPFTKRRWELFLKSIDPNTNEALGTWVKDLLMQEGGYSTAAFKPDWDSLAVYSETYDDYREGVEALYKVVGAMTFRNSREYPIVPGGGHELTRFLALFGSEDFPTDMEDLRRRCKECNEDGTLHDYGSLKLNADTDPNLYEKLKRVNDILLEIQPKKKG